MLRSCAVCGQEKHMSVFKSDPSCRDGYRNICMVCYRTQQRERHAREKVKPEYQEKLAAARRKWDLKKKYGVSPTEYELRLSAQGGVCLICGGNNGNKRLAVDHCHDGGAVRGLLCNQCNIGVGMFRNSLELLQKAIDYLGAPKPHAKLEPPA